MVTIKGAMRTYGAAIRRAEKEQQRRARELKKQYKEIQREEEKENARKSYDDWKNYVNLLISLHKNATQSVSWDEIINTEKPKSPIIESRRQIEARKKLEAFQPSFMDKVFGSGKWKKIALEKALKAAIAADNSAQKNFDQERSNWEELNRIATGVQEKQIESYLAAISYFDPFGELGELGSQLEFDFNQPLASIDLYVNETDVIPEVELSLTSTGKLSKRNMSKSRYNELYQDHICSSIMRVAREVFAYIPIHLVRINAIMKMVNTSSGHKESQVVVSTIFSLQTLSELNFEGIDPSDAMRNFVCNMQFSKTKGFTSVGKAELSKKSK